jgi:DNA-binding transcriptional regulator YiaG
MLCDSLKSEKRATLIALTGKCPACAQTIKHAKCCSKSMRTDLMVTTCRPVRAQDGAYQAEFAASFGTNLGTLRHWE